MRTLIAGLSAFALCACATANAEGQDMTTNPTEPEAVKVFLAKRCPISEGKQKAPDREPVTLGASIAAAAIPALIDVAFSSFSSALSNAATDKTQTFDGRDTAYLYKRHVTGVQTQIFGGPGGAKPAAPPPTSDVLATSQLVPNDDNGCILVVGGKFDGSKASAAEFDYDTHSKLQVVDWRSAKTEEIADAIRNRTGLVGNPYYILELRLEATEQKEAFYLVPTFFELNRWMGTTSGNAKRALAVTLAFDAPRQDEDATTLRSAVFEFGELAPRKRYTEGAFPKAQRSPLLLAMPPSEASTARLSSLGELEADIAANLAELQTLQNKTSDIDEALKSAKDDEERAQLKQQETDNSRQIAASKATLDAAAANHFSLSESFGNGRFTPVDVTATAVETKFAGDLVKFLAAVFEQAKPALTEAAKDALSPDRKQAQEDKEEAEAETLAVQLSTTRTKYLEAKRDYLKLESEDPLDIEIAREAYVEALRLHNVVRAKLGKPLLVE